MLMLKNLENLSREQVFLGASLIGLILLTWLLTVFQVQTMDNSMLVANPSISSSGMILSAFADFVLMWSTMMVAMMLPVATPTILAFDRLAQQESQNQSLPLSGIFGASYILAWILFGIVAYPAILAVQALDPFIDFQNVNSILILLAGVYQFSPLKQNCVNHLQNPYNFINSLWQKGLRGAFFMGMQYGWHCIVCCWGLMLVLIALDLMNLMVMSILTIVILIEKVSSNGVLISRLAGVSFVAYGIWSIVFDLFDNIHSI